MKNNFLCFVFLVVLLIFISFISAQEDLPDAGVGVGDEDIEKIQDIVGDIPIDEETGGLDEEKLELGKSKAEERIASINAWLDENASWLRLVFGMVPEVSWLFGINLALILAFIWLFIFSLPDFSIFSENASRLIGIGLVIITIISKLTVKIATWIDNLAGQWWFKLIVIVAVIILIVIFTAFGKYFKQRRIKMKEEMHRMKLETGAKVAEEFTKSVTDK